MVLKSGDGGWMMDGGWWFSVYLLCQELVCYYVFCKLMNILEITLHMLAWGGEYEFT